MPAVFPSIGDAPARFASFDVYIGAGPAVDVHFVRRLVDLMGTPKHWADEDSRRNHFQKIKSTA